MRVPLIVALCTVSLPVSIWGFVPQSSTQTRLSTKVLASKSLDPYEDLKKRIAAGAIALFLAGVPHAAFAEERETISASGIKYKLPPVNQKNKDRCMFVSSSMGQANGARDSQPDFRMCDMSGKSAEGFDLSGLIGSEANFAGTNFKDAQLSKGFLEKSNFEGADFSNGIVDRCDFEGASLKGAIFTNTVLTSTSFKDADLTNADFTDAYLGDFDLKKLCKNPTLQGEAPKSGADTRASAGCR